MLKLRPLLGVVVGIGGLAWALTACGEEAGTPVGVELGEWFVRPSTAAIGLGKITFAVKNSGKEIHEFVVIKSDLPLTGLPVKEGEVDEDQVQVVGEIENLKPGKSKKLTLDLGPGRYVLICNLVEKNENGELESHYLQGMRALFEVR